MSDINKYCSLRAEVHDFNRFIDILVVLDHDAGRLIGRHVQMAEIPDGEWAEPTMRLTHEQGQQLMDQLWSCGLRPTEGSGSAGSLAATERHLEDMRKIAFQHLNPPQQFQGVFGRPGDIVITS